MIWFGLKLLGIGKYIRDFFIANWKWLVPLLLILAGFLWTKEHYYSLGRDTERLAWEKRVEEESKKNQKLTDSLVSTVNNYGEIARKERDDRIQKETTHEQRIETIIEKPIYSECVIDQEVLDAQNAIKALGPKP